MKWNSFISIITSKLFLIIATTLVSLGYYFYTDHRIDSLKKERAELIEQNKIITEKQNKLVEDIKKSEIAHETIRKQKDELYKSYNKLQEILYRENYGKMPLKEIAEKKPVLVEKRVNESTKKVIDCLKKIASDEHDENC